METLEIKFTDDEFAPEKTREEVRPGNPYIVFSTRPFVEVTLDNPVQRSGLFRITTGISDNDSTKHFIEKISKIVGLKGILFCVLSFFSCLSRKNANYIVYEHFFLYAKFHAFMSCLVNKEDGNFIYLLDIKCTLF